MKEIFKSAKIGLILMVIFIVGLLSIGCEERAVDYEQVSGDERIVIKFSHVVAESTPKGKAARRFAELVNKRTNGRVEVQVYANSQLYQDGEEIKALQAGNVQLIAPATAKMTKFFPELLLFDLPFLFEGYEHIFATVDGPIGTDIMNRLKGYNMLGLAMWDNGFKQMAANRKLVKKEDFIGLKFRIMDSPMLNDQFKSVGAYAQVMPFNEVYQALEQQLVDGMENSLSNIYSKRFDRVLSDITISNHGYLGYVVLTNENFWRELPEDIRQILADTLAEVTLWQRQIAIEENEKFLQLLLKTQEEKITFLTKEQEEAWEQALIPIFRKYQDQIGNDLIKDITAVRAKNLID